MLTDTSLFLFSSQFLLPAMFVLLSKDFCSFFQLLNLLEENIVYINFVLSLCP